MTIPSHITTEQREQSDTEQRIEEIRADMHAAICRPFGVVSFDGEECRILLDYLASIPAQIQAAVEAERAKTNDLLAKCRVALGTAAFHDEGLDPTEADPLIEAIGQTIGDSDDYNASLKSSDDMCERCGEGAIRHVIKMGYAKYDGVCDGCFNLDVAAIRSRGEAK